MLGRCLESVKEADEIVVCDTGSTDGTINIINNYTNKLYFYKWNDSFADARNYAKSKCQSDWILSIDADEYLEPNGIQKIKDLIQTETHQTISVKMTSSDTQFYFPRLYRNVPEIKWEGCWHNYLNVSEDNQTDIQITYEYSPTHEKDPDRGIRIGEKSVYLYPKNERYKFYLAREYMYKEEWNKAINMFKEYFKLAWWAPEWSYGHFLCSQCYNNLENWQEAKNQCLQAIKINTNFKEAIEWMSELSGPVNRKRWLEFAQTATNEDVLFVNQPPERSEEYYDDIFKSSSDMSRYKNIHLKIGELVKHNNVLDIGCGTAELAKYIKGTYHGYDFSIEAIKIANQNIKDGDFVCQTDIYNRFNYQDKYDYYLCCEVLEHIDDFKVIRNIPSSSKIIFTVPSFKDPGHVRTYTEEIVRIRYERFIDIEEIIRFNWHDKWEIGEPETSSYILLIRGRKV